MKPFNPDLNAHLIETHLCSNTAELERFERNQRDETPEEEAELRERIEARANQLLKDTSFICEAFSEMPKDDIGYIGFCARENRGLVSGRIDYIVSNHLRAYALSVARKELNV